MNNVFENYKMALKFARAEMIEKTKTKNVLIYDYHCIDCKYYPKKKSKKTSFSGFGISGFGISSIQFSLNFNMRLSSDLFIIDIIPTTKKDLSIISKKVSTKDNSLKIYVIDEIDYSIINEIFRKNKENLDLNEKKLILEELNKRDPLNLNRIYMFLQQFELDDYEVKRYIEYTTKMDSSNIIGKSKYIEVDNILQEFESLKKQKNEILYGKYVNFAYEVFNKYFKDDFIYGIIILGSNLFSILASIGQGAKAIEVFYKLRMYINVQYDEMTQKENNRYKNKVQIKATSIFSYEEYMYFYKENLMSEDVLDLIVYNNNMAALNISNGKYSIAKEYLQKINLDYIVNVKNTEGVKYESIVYNNLFIANLFYSNNGDIDNMNYSRREEHIIFELNYYAYQLLYTEFDSNIDIKNKKKLGDSFYQFHKDILDILRDLKANNECNYDQINLEIPELYIKSSTYNEWKKLIELIKNEAEYSELYNFFNENPYKLLFIDFNIWDY